MEVALRCAGCARTSMGAGGLWWEGGAGCCRTACFGSRCQSALAARPSCSVSYTHLRAHETSAHL
eukprot:15453571-Alexandrium_andersonii.AAC.1